LVAIGAAMPANCILVCGITRERAKTWGNLHWRMWAGPVELAPRSRTRLTPNIMRTGGQADADRTRGGSGTPGTGFTAARVRGNAAKGSVGFLSSPWPNWLIPLPRLAALLEGPTRFYVLSRQGRCGKNVGLLAPRRLPWPTLANGCCWSVPIRPSNLGEVLGQASSTALLHRFRGAAGLPGIEQSILKPPHKPIRDRMVVLSRQTAEAILRSMESSCRGACTMEIAALTNSPRLLRRTSPPRARFRPCDFSTLRPTGHHPLRLMTPADRLDRVLGNNYFWRPPSRPLAVCIETKNDL